jgi:hypothetical protein
MSPVLFNDRKIKKRKLDSNNYQKQDNRISKQFFENIPIEIWILSFSYLTDIELLQIIIFVNHNWYEYAQKLIGKCLLTACKNKDAKLIQEHIEWGTAWFTNRMWYEKCLFEFAREENLEMVKLLQEHHESIVEDIQRYKSNYNKDNRKKGELIYLTKRIYKNSIIKEIIKKNDSDNIDMIQFVHDFLFIQFTEQDEKYAIKKRRYRIRAYIVCPDIINCKKEYQDYEEYLKFEQETHDLLEKFLNLQVISSMWLTQLPWLHG